MRVRSLAAPLIATIGVLTMLVVGSPPAPSSAPASAAGPPPAAGAVGERPNIVLILTDDMRADELRLMPNVRRLLVEQGTSYRRAISPHPVCCPARAEIVTGQYGQNNGVRNNTGPWGGYQALEEPGNTVGTWLKRAGYNTSHHGKYLNGYERFAARRERGWTRWDTMVHGIYNYEYASVFADGDRSDGRYITRVIARRSIGTMIRFAQRGEPFFTIVNHVAPHGARREGVWRYPIPEDRYRDRFSDLLPPSYGAPSFQEADISDLPGDLRRPRIPLWSLVGLAKNRARALLSVDQAVKHTIQRLREIGELRNTYVVFASDNGFQIGEHRQRGKNLPFDETFNIPLVIRGPRIARGAVVDEPVTLVDLTATFLDWAGGVRARRPLDGLSLREIGAFHPRDTLLVQIGDSADDATDGWRYRGVTTERYLFATHAGNPSKGILFDRELDPYATVNLFRDRAYAAVRRELLRRTQELSTCSGQEACNQEFGPLPEPD